MLALQALDPEGAVAAFTVALKQYPDDPFARQWRAEAYLLSGDQDHALADNAAAIRLSPKRTDLYERRALVLRVQHKLDAALHQAAAVVTANPNDASAYIAAGDIYSASKKAAEAMQSFDRAVEIGQSERAYLARAQHRPRADLLGRKADIEAALKLNSTSRRAILLLADVQAEARDHAGAIATLGAALATWPDDEALRTRRAIAYLKNNQLSLAQQDLAKVDAHATRANALNGFCWALATAGVELEKALSSCDAAIAKAPNVAAYLDSRGFVLLRMGRNADAIAAYDASLKWRPMASMSLYGRGLAKRRQGDAAGADADIGAALVSDAEVADAFAEFGLH
jgi:tetratricopeptide (TPR) repeat protein